MKEFLLLIIGALVLMSFSVVALADDVWIMDFKKAKKMAKKQDKLIFVLFTADWCGPCKRLKEEVLTKAEFKKLAKKNFILFKTEDIFVKEQSQALKDQNEELCEKYKVKKYLPVMLVLDARGNVLYRDFGFSYVFLKKLKKFLTWHEIEKTMEGRR